MPNEFDTYLAGKQAADSAPAAQPNEFDQYLSAKTGALDTAPSKADAALRGVANGATAGFADEATAGAGALKDYLSAKFGLRGDIGLGDAYQSWLKPIRAADAAAEKAHPAIFGGAQLAGGAALAAAPGLGALNAGKGAELAEMVGKGAVQGGLAGYGNSNSKTAGGDIANAAIGAGLGGALGGVASGAGKAAGALSDYLGGAANSRTIKALAPTLRQQEVLNNSGTAADLAQGLRDQGVVRFGSSVNDILPRLEDFLGQKGQRIGDIRNEVSGAMGDSVDLGRLKNKADALSAFTDASDTATQKMADAYGQNAENLAKVPKRNVNEAQEVVQSLNNQIPFERATADMTPEQQALRQLRGDIVGQVDDSVKQYSPELNNEYQGLKDQFGLFKNAEPILDKSVARQSRNATFGLRDMLAAGLPNNSNPGAGLKQGLVAVGSKLARERGNSAAAVTFDKLSGLLKSDPSSLGQFGPVLQAAAERGLPSLMATHQALINNPDYQKAIEGPDASAAKTQSDKFAQTYGTSPDASRELGIQNGSFLPDALAPTGTRMGAAPVPPEFEEAEDGTPVLNYGSPPKKTITQATTGFKPRQGVRVLPDSSNLTTEGIAALLKKLGGAP